MPIPRRADTLGRDRVHYNAPPAEQSAEQTRQCLARFSADPTTGRARCWPGRAFGSATSRSPDTAGRDRADLLAKGMLMHEDAGGRSTSYRLAPEA